MDGQVEFLTKLGDYPSNHILTNIRKWLIVFKIDKLDDDPLNPFHIVQLNN